MYIIATLGSESMQGRVGHRGDTLSSFPQGIELLRELRLHPSGTQDEEAEGRRRRKKRRGRRSASVLTAEPLLVRGTRRTQRSD